MIVRRKLDSLGEYEIEAYDGEMLAEAGSRNGVPFTKESKNRRWMQNIWK